jgi:hypothetical protein
VLSYLALAIELFCAKQELMWYYEQNEREAQKGVSVKYDAGGQEHKE